MSREEYFDEKIIKMINHAENPTVASTATTSEVKEIPPEERSIHTGIKIGGQWIEFEERVFVNGKIVMTIPKEFREMDAETAKIKYPMEQRPQTIMTDSTGAVNILFNYMDATMTNAEAEMFRDKLFSLMCRLNPGVRSQSIGCETIADKNIAYVEFSNPAMDGKLYNLMFFLEVEGKPLMCSFNCLTKSMKYWQKAAFEMMRSIKVTASENE